MEELIQRCSWATTDLYKEYHDHEWGKPVHDENKLFEMLILENHMAVLIRLYGLMLMVSQFSISSKLKPIYPQGLHSQIKLVKT